MKKKEDYDLELYGEMVPTLNAWMTPDKQRERVEEIEEKMNKKKKK